MVRFPLLPVFVSLLVGIGLGWLMFHPIPPDARVPGADAQPPPQAAPMPPAGSPAQPPAQSPATPSVADAATATVAAAELPAQPAPAPPAAAPKDAALTPAAAPGAHNLDGFGKAALALDLLEGPAVLRMTYSGEGNFVVRVLDAKGEKVGGSVANEIGAWSGSKTVKIPRAGKYVIDVDTSGPWTIIVGPGNASGAR